MKRVPATSSDTQTQQIPPPAAETGDATTGDPPWGAVNVSAPLMFFTLDRAGAVTFFHGQCQGPENDPKLAALGLGPGRLIGRSIFEAYAHLPEGLDATRRALAGEEVTYTMGLHDRHVQLHYAPLRDGAGQPAGALAVVVDLTDCQRAQQSLALLAEASRRLGGSLDLRLTLPALSKLLATSVADCCAISVLQESCRMVVGAHSDPAKDALWQAGLPKLGRGVPSDDSPLRRAVYQGSVLLRNDLAPGELWALAGSVVAADMGQASQSFQPRALLAVPLSAAGRLLGGIILIRERPMPFGDEDLALAREMAQRVALAVDQARLYLEAQDAVRLREDFIYIASHEMRTPLNGMHMHLQLPLFLEEHGRGAEVSKESLLKTVAKADRNILRMTQLLDKLLDVSRLTSGTLPLSSEEVDLSALVREVAERLGADLRKCGSVLTLTLPQSGEGLVTGIWDRLRVEQIVTNLLSNAIKYGEGRPIELRVEGDERQGRVTVIDQGIGIALEHQARIFRRFERATTESKEHSLGLGLYIVREIAAAMGGQVRLESCPGAGSTFTLELPRRRMQTQ